MLKVAFLLIGHDGIEPVKVVFIAVRIDFEKPAVKEIQRQANHLAFSAVFGNHCHFGNS